MGSSTSTVRRALVLLWTSGIASSGLAVAPAVSTPGTGVALMRGLRAAEGGPVVVMRDGREYLVFAPLPESDPRKAIALASLNTHPTVSHELRLLESVKRGLAGKPPPGLNPEAWARAIQDPFYFSVDGVLEERAWAGFVLRTASGDEDHLLTPFVELTSTVESLKSGEIAEVMVHELAHCIYYVASAGQVFPCFHNLGQCIRAPGVMHDVQRATFALQAVNEGVAEHFEVMNMLQKRMGDHFVRTLDPARALRTARGYVSPRPRRLEYVMQYRLVFEPALIPEDVITRVGMDEAYRQSLDSPSVDNHRLRSCGEMLSTEGVVATILTRLIMDRQLQENPLPDALISTFAPKDRATWLKALGPTGKVQLRLFHAMTRVPASTQPNPDVGIREILQIWMGQFPADAPAISRVVVMTTLGATVSAPLAAKLRALLAEPAVVPALDPRKREVMEAHDQLTALASQAHSPESLFAACGPALWVQVPGRQQCTDYASSCKPMEVDLNAASFMDFRMFSGFGVSRAQAVVIERERQGFFAGYADFFALAKLPKDVEAHMRQPRLEPSRK